ncbi:MAG: short-chain dehydrogenase/reductase [Pseudonocardiales bacterium]|nr:short-chain dehydrogenase/reductase [Pseudonocardiales bacterium]
MPTALVTGATAGIGAEFARQLAEQGSDLVLVARDAARLESARTTLADRYGVAVSVLPADLTTDDGCAAVAARVGQDDEPIDVLVNNAGSGMYQLFGEADLVDEERQLDLNVRAVLRLTHAAVRAMTPRASGRIINISSVSAFVPRGGNATYAASKAWVTLFSEALSVQLAGSGVSVTAVCPGFTHTEFHERAHADMSHVPDRMWLDAATVVSEGLADAARGKPVSVPSRQYKTLVAAARAVPRPLLRRIMARRAF